MSERKPQTRLTVNINRHTEAALRAVAAEHDTTITEALRILVGYGHYAWRSQEDGYTLAREKGGNTERFVHLR